MGRSMKQLRSSFATADSNVKKECDALLEHFGKLTSALYTKNVATRLLQEMTARSKQIEANKVAMNNIRQQESELKARRRAIRNGLFFFLQIWFFHHLFFTFHFFCVGQQQQALPMSQQQLIGTEIVQQPALIPPQEQRSQQVTRSSTRLLMPPNATPMDNLEAQMATSFSMDEPFDYDSTEASY